MAENDALRIKSVEFAGAIAKAHGPRPGTLPQIAFSGRSNVGKSSLINVFLGRTRTPIARVSATPGKTQEINFYDVRAELGKTRDVRFYLVDLPGYGFARAPAALRQTWRPLIEWYLSKTPELRGVVQLIDIRHGPTRADLQMVEYLGASGLPTLFVLTKADKLGKTQQANRIAQAVEQLGVAAEQVLPFSALTGAGRAELSESVAALLD
jgi:GTP-binding protein